MWALLLRPELKKESNVGRFENESNIAENRMIVSTRTPDGIAFRYLNPYRTNVENRVSS